MQRCEVCKYFAGGSNTYSILKACLLQLRKQDLMVEFKSLGRVQTKPEDERGTIIMVSMFFF